MIVTGVRDAHLAHGQVALQIVDAGDGRLTQANYQIAFPNHRLRGWTVGFD